VSVLVVVDSKDPYIEKKNPSPMKEMGLSRKARSD
jgi:hypothetical protein